MKSPKNNYCPKKLILLFILFSAPHLSFSQTPCGNPIEIRDNITLCQNETFQFGTKLIASPGIYIQTFKTVSTNCDSIVTLGVDYLNNSNFSFTEIISTNENYLFNDQTLTEAGVYKDTLNDANGCDSVLTLTLQVINEQEHCENGIDDDGDGLIDAFDNDCLCLINGMPVNLIPNGGFEEKVGCCRALPNDENMCIDNWVNLSGEGIVYHNPDCWAVLGQELVLEGITLESGLMSGRIRSGASGTNLSGMSLGICLNEPMYAGNTYTLSFDIGRSFQNNLGTFPENMNFTVNGISDCESLENYRFDQNFCQKNLPFELLSSVELIKLGPKWNHFEFEIIPNSTIEAIFLGGNCGAAISPFQNASIFYDNFSIVSIDGLRIKNEINILGNSCQDDPQLSIPNTNNFAIDWYKDSILLPQISGRPFVITPDITANKNGTYHAKVKFEDGRCQLVGPIVIETLDLTLPADTTICPNQNLLLSFAQTDVQYKWQDGSTEPAFSVNTEGLYWVEAQKGDCVFIDSIQVSYAKQRSFLPNDTTICQADSFLITPQAPFDHVLWWESPLMLDGLSVSEDGTYHAFIIDQGCDWLDSIKVSFVEVPELNLGTDTILCQNESLTLMTPPEIRNFQWQDGTNSTAKIVNQPDLYWLKGTINDCVVQDSILIMYEDCKEELFTCEAYLPNSFSPNGDGINDRLKLLSDCDLLSFEMQVYDRWGNLLFSTKDARLSWDGKYNGQLADTGSYLWVVNYQFVNQPEPIRKIETINLLR